MWKYIEEKDIGTGNLKKYFVFERGPVSISFYLFLLISILFFSSCSTQYNLSTGQQETLIYSTAKEVNVGSKVAAQLEKHYDINTDVDINEKVDRILDKLVAVCDRQDILYRVKIIDKDILNAVSLPGGYIYIFKGVLDKAKNDDEIAAVIAHELGHINARHSVKRIQASYGAMLFQLLAVETAPQTAGGVGLALNSIFLHYSQEDEFEADKLSVKYLKKAGFNPEGVRTFLETMQAEKEKEPLKAQSYWHTHPYLSQRIAVVNKEINGKLEFKDYLNLIDTDQI